MADKIINETHPEVEREISAKKQELLKNKHVTSMRDLVASRESDISGSAVVGPAKSILREELERAAGRKPVAERGVKIEDSPLEFLTPDHAWEAYEKGEVRKEDMINVVAKLGLIKPEEVEDMTIKKAIAVLKAEIDDIEAPQTRTAAVKEEVIPKEEVTKEVTETMDNIELKKKAQYAQPQQQPSQPQQPSTEPMTVTKQVETQQIPTAGSVIVMIDPATQQKKQYQMMPDGSLKPITTPMKTVTSAEIEARIPEDKFDIKRQLIKKLTLLGTQHWAFVTREDRIVYLDAILNGTKTVDEVAKIINDKAELEDQAERLQTEDVQNKVVASENIKKESGTTNPTVEPSRVGLPISVTSMASTNSTDLDSNWKNKEKADAINTLSWKTYMGQTPKVRPPDSIMQNCRKYLKSQGYSDTQLDVIEGKTFPDEIQTGEKVEARKYTASLNKDRWVLSEDSQPLFSVGMAEAFPESNEATTEMWRSSEYGEELESACSVLGIDKVITDVYGGDIKIEMEEKTAMNVKAPDFSQMLFNAIQAKDMEAIQTLLPMAQGVNNVRKDIEVQKIIDNAKNILSGRQAQYTDGKVLNVEPQMEQEPAAIMAPDIGEDMAKKEKPAKSVVEYITDLLAPTIAQTEVWTTDEIVEQLKATFNDDEEIANFKGALDEKIKQLQVDEQMVIEKTKPKIETPMEDKPAPEAGQALAEEQQARASKIAVKNLITKIEATKSDITKISKYVDDVSKETVELRQRNSSLKQQTEDLATANDKLVKERSARLRLPKAKILAKKMTEIGIKTELKDIMMYREDEFTKREAEVEQIWKTVGHREPRQASENLIGGSLPRITGVPMIEDKHSGFTSRAPENT